jgi:predicted glycoside hydrolase/deacetylase ChbG (UPF0249 family)
MKYLIINADDFGFSEGVTSGILKSMQEGVVSRTSVMLCNGNLQGIKEHSELLQGRLGLHLQLTDGTALSPAEKVSSLVKDGKDFPEHWRDIDMNAIRPEEIAIEWEEQINSMIKMGILPSHLDSHHNVHRFPVIFNVFTSLAKKYDLPVRPLSINMRQRFQDIGLKGVDHCCYSWTGMKLSPENFIAHVLGAFRRIENKGVVEFVCHPGYCDTKLEKRSSYVKERECELEVLCKLEIKNYLLQYDIHLINSVVPPKNINS